MARLFTLNKGTKKLLEKEVSFFLVFVERKVLTFEISYNYNKDTY